MKQPNTLDKGIGFGCMAALVVKFVVFVVSLLFFLAGVGCAEEKSTLYKAMGVALVGTSASDAWSTEYVLARADVREGNPFMATNTEARLALKASATALVFAGTDYAHSKGHTRLALWTRIVVVAGYGYVTMHNLRHLR